MDLDNAVNKHAEWKVKFRTAMTSRETLDAATISKDNCCELGKWLHGEAKTQWSKLPAYRECLERHASFHTAAGQVAQAINAKRYAEAESMLGQGMAYSGASLDVITAIRRLKKEAGL